MKRSYVENPRIYLFKRAFTKKYQYFSTNVSFQNMISRKKLGYKIILYMYYHGPGQPRAGNFINYLYINIIAVYKLPLYKHNGGL